METATDIQHFRFFDNREKYLLFVTTCSEKWVVADRVGMEFRHLRPTPPALRVFDAGMGDATVLSQVMRQLHHRFPTIPFLVVGKEVSLEDVRISLGRMGDRFSSTRRRCWRSPTCSTPRRRRCTRATPPCRKS